VKILLVERLAAPKLGAALSAAGHQVIPAKDEPSAMAALTADAFRFLIMSVRSGDETALALLRAMRKTASLDAISALVMVHECTEEYLLKAYEAGADFSLRGPCAPALVLAQLKSASRLATAGGAGAGADGVAAEAAGGTPLEQINRSKTWRNAKSAIQLVSSKFLTLDVALVETDTVTEPPTHACTIALSNAQHQLEMRIALGTDDASGKHLAVHMFGPEGTDMIGDMMTELANNLMGTLKTSLSSESLAFTGGLPQPLDAKEVLRPSAVYNHQIAFAMRMADAAILVHVSIRSKANLFLRPAVLREGMVLAKDVFNARGQLMLHAGTRLSLNMVEKISGFMAEKSQLEVVAP
jgi:DNA-binding response OmpR family regulator